MGQAAVERGRVSTHGHQASCSGRGNCGRAKIEGCFNVQSAAGDSNRKVTGQGKIDRKEEKQVKLNVSPSGNARWGWLCCTSKLKLLSLTYFS